ncbi:beta-phosphoglucomutase family hydrolase [Glutamicibacter sp. V16R2B1]|uniref:beta-phosphoglucomutase family hydrolase n=1 Tax=Glutamicibacter sp. V16R2B1 TaxID=2036207 RepID=UPI0010FE3D12|nr:beta-phosphoglucomutase family hydrolase [Glutamicibacter sp. V16R2B1]TLK57323.1 beta-phosphoglucomutase family hydrolase [Glutamicibacter sp. V16R2B1]
MNSSRPMYRHRDFKAVLFDLDGVLTPTAQVHREAWQELFDRFLSARHPEAAPYTLDDYFTLVDGRPRYDGVQAVLDSRGISLPHGTGRDLPGFETVCALGNLKNDVFIDILEREGIAPYQGSLDFLNQVLDAGLDVAVVSSSRNARTVLNAAELADFFPTVVSGTEATLRQLPGKPAPDTFLAAARDLGWRPEECVVIEDAVSGVQAAVAGGFRVIGVARENNAASLAEAGADFVVTDLSEVMTDESGDALSYDPWSITLDEARDDEGAQDTVFSLGNGFLGAKAPMLGVGDQVGGSFINGLHETWQIRYAENAYGLASTGQTMIAAPDFRTMRVYINDEALEVGRTEMVRDDLRLDFRDGTLVSTTLWRTAEGHRVAVTSRAMVSFTDRHLAVVDVNVRLLDAPGHVVVQSSVIGIPPTTLVPTPADLDAGEPSPLDPRKSESTGQNPLQPAGHYERDGRAGLSYIVRGSGMSVATVAEHRASLTGGSQSRIHTTTDVSAERSDHVASASLQPGEGLRLSKFVAYHSSRRHTAREMLARSHRALGHLVPRGADDHFRGQRTYMGEFWQRSDVRVDSDDKTLQRKIRWNIFQLAQASARADGLGISAKGTSGNGYSGHYFWDTEIYVLPFLTYTNPQWARNALRARVSMLPAATRRAQIMNEDGILFPWRTINGEEASAYYPAGTAQYHINADIAYALNRYMNATGDVEFLRSGGAEILVGTARMWSSLGFWRTTGSRQSFHIHGVTGPDEYTAIVNDNVYTNVMARFNLRCAADMLDTLANRFPRFHAELTERLQIREGEAENWRKAAHCFHIPFSERVGIHPQDEHFLNREIWDVSNTDPAKLPLLLHYHPLVIYRFQVIKQADTVLALWLRSSDFTDAEKLADFNYYDPLTTGDSSLSAAVQSIVAAEVGYRDLAYEYFQAALNVDLENSHRNTADGVHVASTGGVWATLIYGFAGMRDDGDVLSFDPRLPASWSTLSFRLAWRGSMITVRLNSDSMRLSMEGGATLYFAVRGKNYSLSASEPVEIELDAHGQVREGKPSMEHVVALHSEDSADVMQPPRGF